METDRREQSFVKEYAVAEAARALEETKQDMIELGRELAGRVKVIAELLHTAGFFPQIQVVKYLPQSGGVKDFPDVIYGTASLLRVGHAVPIWTDVDTDSVVGYFVTPEGIIESHQESKIGGIGIADTRFISEKGLPVPATDLLDLAPKALKAMQIFAARQMRLQRGQR